MQSIHLKAISGTGANGVIFVIDRDLDEIYLACEGSTAENHPESQNVTPSADNTYIYATSSHDYDYFTCCMETIDQVNTVLAADIYHSLSDTFRASLSLSLPA